MFDAQRHPGALPAVPSPNMENIAVSPDEQAISHDEPNATTTTEQRTPSMCRHPRGANCAANVDELQRVGRAEGAVEDGVGHEDTLDTPMPSGEWP